MSINRERKTINDVFESLSSQNSRPVFLQMLAESTGSSAASLQKFLAKNGSLPAPSMAEMTRMILTHPELASFVRLSSVDGDGCAHLEGPAIAAILEKSNLQDDPPATEGVKKKKKRNKKKKKAPGSDSGRGPNVLRPRNFLEAALYFSTITSSTVGMAMDLEPEHFFAPPLLFERPSEEIDTWLASLRKESIGTIQFEGKKNLQRRTAGLFAIGLLQTAQHIKSGAGAQPGPTAATDYLHQPSVAVRSNYLKRSIGLYAISLVDNLPPSLTCRLGDAEKALGPMNIPTTQAQRLLLKNNPLLANRKLELNDLKVPSPQQLSSFWLQLSSTEKVAILSGEQNTLQRGWINPKKTWCMCKYCRTRSLRLGDIYELLYRAYYDDLERVASIYETATPGADGRKPTPAPPPIAATDGNGTLKIKTRRQLYKHLSILADDICNEQSSYLVMVLKRLGRAFEEDFCDWQLDEHANNNGKAPHDNQICDCCRHPQHNFGGALGKDGSTMGNSGKCSMDKLPDGFDDDEGSGGDEHDTTHGTFSDERLDDDDDFDTFYEDFNLMEDEEIIQGECELPLDPAHLSTSFPALYDSRAFSLPTPPSCWSHHPHPPNSVVAVDGDTERIDDGAILYEHLASLLFQFHLVPRYLEAEAITRQRRLLEEEEERERLEADRVLQKAAARQRKKERLKAAKLKQKEEAAELARLGQVAEEPPGEEAEQGTAVIDAQAATEADERAAIGPFEGVGLNNADQEPATESEQCQEPEIISHSDVDDGTPPGLSPPTTTAASHDDLTDEEGAPPGLQVHPESYTASTVELTGEAPSNLPATWFDKILGRRADSSLDSLWSPLAPSIKTGSLLDPSLEMPPGFANIWSPFTSF